MKNRKNQGFGPFSSLRYQIVFFNCVGIGVGNILPPL